MSHAWDVLSNTNYIFAHGAGINSSTVVFLGKVSMETDVSFRVGSADKFKVNCAPPEYRAEPLYTLVPKSYLKVTTC